MSETDQSQQKPEGCPVDEKRFDEVLERLVGKRTDEEISADIDAGRWPFKVSEEQMRADIASWEKPKKDDSKNPSDSG